VLALQGDFEAHAKALQACGVDPVYVRRTSQLAEVDVLCMPGGESTTMSLLLTSSGIRESLRKRIRDGMPVFATCAGLILLARELSHDDGSVKVDPLGLLDVRVERNAYGRQVDSFEDCVDVDWKALSLDDQSPLRAHFIRAPLIREPGPGVQVLARRGEEIVLVRQDNIIGATFHPEIAGDYRLHEVLLGLP
jgi:5'-phosphate synthase pdxT subunit